MNKLFIIIALSFLSLLSSCDFGREDFGPKQSGERSFLREDFNKISIGSAFEVEIVQSGAFSVLAEGDRRNLEDLRVDVINNELRAYYADGGNRRYTTRIRIQMPELEKLEFYGASEARVQGFEALNDLEVRLSGASEAELDLETQALILHLEGASKLRMLAANSQDMIAHLSGASELKAFDWEVERAHLKLDGASEAQVRVRDRLEVQGRGASTVYYRGNPNDIISDLTEASQVLKD